MGMAIFYFILSNVFFFLDCKELLSMMSWQSLMEPSTGGFLELLTEEERKKAEGKGKGYGSYGSIMGGSKAKVLFWYRVIGVHL
jgi:hypothetical protein